MKYAVPTATSDFKIKASSISGKAEINADYIIDANDLNAEAKWFIYDFTVTLGENRYEQFEALTDGDKKGI